jgi:hypothetical protein
LEKNGYCSADCFKLVLLYVRGNSLLMVQIGVSQKILILITLKVTGALKCFAIIKIRIFAQKTLPRE